MDKDRETDTLRRLERSFSEQQNVFQQTRDDVNSLKTGYNIIQRDIMSLGTSVEKLVSRFEESSKTNWPLLALGAGLIPLMVGGMGYLMASYTANAVSPISAQIAQIEVGLKNNTQDIAKIGDVQAARAKDLGLLAQTATTNSEILNRNTASLHDLSEKVAASAAADANSKTDRLQLNDRLSKIESVISTEIATRRAVSAETRVQLAEVEQQFHSVSNLENLRAAQQERLNAMLWEKSHPGERYPNGTFFPTSIFQGSGGSPQITTTSP